MADKKKKFESIDEYIGSFPKNIQTQLKKVRETIRKALPGAEEIISYQIPTYKVNGKYIIYFAAWKNHIALYPVHTGVETLKKEMEKYKGSKSSVHFPLGKPLPLALVRKIVKLKAIEHQSGGTKKNPLNKDIQAYNAALPKEEKAICRVLAQEICRSLPAAENKTWHGHPVWFLDGNPIVGYSKLKDSVRLLFWSGRSFKDEGLQPEGSFQAAEARYTSAKDIKTKDLKRWLAKSKRIQWDYKNIVKHKGVLKRLS
jgi:uncharacterized protein YdhG (YjbR/CyaY superfamily)